MPAVRPAREACSALGADLLRADGVRQGQGVLSVRISSWTWVNQLSEVFSWLTWCFAGSICLVWRGVWFVKDKLVLKMVLSYHPGFPAGLGGFHPVAQSQATPMPCQRHTSRDEPMSPAVRASGLLCGGLG